MHAVVHGLGGKLTPETALGALSLIVWTLVLILCVKYAIFVMRADNRGEGGTLALMAMIGAGRMRGPWWWLTALGLFGAALLYGDGIITPAISVLSAIEGAVTAAPSFHPYVLPVALIVLVGLFLVQSLGTAKIGAAFGPIMLVWFVAIATLGIVNIARHPAVLAAVDPIHAVRFFEDNGWRAVLAMGGIFLCVTGGEALYADMGHFGRWPIRWAWYGLVFPALFLNYAGQIAHLLADPAALSDPFFRMAPSSIIYPLVALATIATVVASQAIISGVFSLSRQAMQLGRLPGMTIYQTSSDQYGQIYVPFMNWLMMLGTLALALIFRTSDRLAGAYGMAVSATMLLTSILLIRCMRHNWKWPLLAVSLVGTLFLIVDTGFLAANLVKLTQGGWIPLLVAVAIFVVMATWRAGLDALHRRMPRSSCERCRRLLQQGKVQRVPGTAVFLTRQRLDVPGLLIQHIQHMGALHENAVALTVLSTDRPRVEARHRAQIKYLGEGLWRVTVRFGFLEETNLLQVLENISELDTLDFRKVIWFGARDLVVHDTRHPRLGRWRLALFAFLFRNSVKTMDRFNIPAENFVEIAREIKL
jgi:KUP system potassium uptake protein